MSLQLFSLNQFGEKLCFLINHLKNIISIAYDQSFQPCTRKFSLYPSLFAINLTIWFEMLKFVSDLPYKLHIYIVLFLMTHLSKFKSLCNSSLFEPQNTSLQKSLSLRNGSTITIVQLWKLYASYLKILQYMYGM